MKNLGLLMFVLISLSHLGAPSALADGSACSMRFSYATVRNARPSPMTPGACEFQILVADPESESGCSLEVGEVDSQLYSDPHCELSEGNSIGGYVFRTSSGNYEIDFYKRH